MDNIEQNDLKVNDEGIDSVIKDINEKQKELQINKNEYAEIKKLNPVKNLRNDSYYDAKLLDLMGWNALRVLLTIMTLGIGAPWGECLYLKYKMSHTVFNGKRLKFVGDGSELFVERFKWTFLTMITFGIYAFWIPVKKTSWMVSNIYFEDEECVKGESFFGGSVLKYVGINILCFVITIISFGLLFPLAECIKLRWLSKNTIISRKLVVFDGKALNLFGNYLKWIFFTIITFGIYGLWLALKKTYWEVSHTHLISNDGYKVEKNNSKAIILVGIVIAIIIVLLIITFVIPNINLSFGNQSNALNDVTQPAIQVAR